MISPEQAYLIDIANETLAVCQSGVYRNEYGETINISMSLKNAIELSHHIAPGADVVDPQIAKFQRPINSFDTKFHVLDRTNLSIAKRFANDGVCVLNFASAKKPGGDFLLGSFSQEEFLCRCSGLYPCIVKSPMYSYAIGIGNGEYSDYAIHSPNVPVFRDNNYGFLEEPYFCSFVTCAAPNYNDNCFSGIDHSLAMKKRIDRVLKIMAAKGYDQIILGAWGCGSFGHNPEVVARLFHEALNSQFKGVFSVVVFAIADSSKTKSTIKPFEKLFNKAS